MSRRDLGQVEAIQKSRRALMSSTLLRMRARASKMRRVTSSNMPRQPKRGSSVISIAGTCSAWLVRTAGKVCIVEVEKVVEVGELAPDDIHLPGLFVDRLFEARDHQNPIEYRTTRRTAPP